MSASFRYDVVSQTLHWLTAPLILVLLVIGWLMVDMPLGLKRFDTVNLHKSLGVLVLVLTLMRLLYYLMMRPAAESPANLLARIAHKLLYLCLLGMPLTGWLMSNAAGFGVTVYGTAELPVLLNENAELQAFFEQLHFWFSRGLCVLLAGHIGAVLWHAFWRKDEVWQRMSPFR